MYVSGLALQNFHYQIAILRDQKRKKYLFSKCMAFLYRNSYQHKPSLSVTVFLRSFVDLCTYSYLRKGQRQGIKVIMRCNVVRVICNSLFDCCAAEWQWIAAGTLRFCFHWKREWQTAEITKGIFLKHSIYWITSQIQPCHLFRFFPSPFHIFLKWPASQLILEEHREECGLYRMTCSQWTCSISFRDEFCFLPLPPQ